MASRKEKLKASLPNDERKSDELCLCKSIL